MKKIIPLLIILTILINCKPACDESLRMGEMVEIPINFDGFGLIEIENINVYRIDKANTALIDTFKLSSLLWGNMARSESEIITDEDVSGTGRFGYYGSYLDNCHLILDWNTGRDTLRDVEIKKSRGVADRCHTNDPNVKIDKISFIHRGKTIGKGESIEISK